MADAKRAARGPSDTPDARQGEMVRPVSERLRDAREELEAKLLRLEEDERDQSLLSSQQLTVADIERAMAAAADAGGNSPPKTELDVQLAQRLALDRPIVDSSGADDPFAGLVQENRELSERLRDTREALKTERNRAEAAETELVRLQLQNTVGLRQLVGTGGAEAPTSGNTEAECSPYPARMHLSVRELVEENTQLRAAATSLEEQLHAAKLELALTQEELERRTL